MNPIDRLKAVVYPRKCVLCRDLLRRGEVDLCDPCRRNQPEYPYSFANPAPKSKNKLHFLDSFTAVWYYEEDARACIHRYKFKGGVYLAPRLGRLLAEKLASDGPQEYDILTWVPVNWHRLLERGFDQSKLLARFAAKTLGGRHTRTLRKIRNTPPQYLLKSESERKANVLGAFRVIGDVRDKRVLLIDDIYTTGATAEECTRVLLTAGAKEVHCAAMAAAHDEKR